MGKFIARKIFGGLVTLFVVITLSFFMMKAAPGGPFDKDRAYPPEVLEKIKETYILDKPLLVQYGLHLKGLVVDFDLGQSTRYADRSVNELIATSFGFSIKIGLGALAFALLIGLIAGLVAALNRN